MTNSHLTIAFALYVNEYIKAQTIIRRRRKEKGIKLVQPSPADVKRKA